MSEEKKEPQEEILQPPIERYTVDGVPLLGVEAHLDRPAIDAEEMRKKIVGRKIETPDLVDQTFLIKAARQFPSAYDEQKMNPWFVIGVMEETGELFNTVIGGDAVAREIEAWAMSSLRYNPLRVTLLYHEGKGAGKGYYTFK